MVLQLWQGNLIFPWCSLYPDPCLYNIYPFVYIYPFVDTSKTKYQSNKNFGQDGERLFVIFKERV